MGRSYADIKYDLWHNLGKIGVSPSDIVLAFKVFSGSRVFSLSPNPAVGQTANVRVAETGYKFNGSSSQITFPLRPRLHTGFYFSATLKVQAYSNCAIFDTKRAVDWDIDRGVAFGLRAGGGYNFKVGSSECLFATNDALPLLERFRYAGHWLPGVTQDAYKNGSLLPTTARAVEASAISAPIADVLIGTYYTLASVYHFNGILYDFILIEGADAYAPDKIRQLDDRMWHPRPDIRYFDQTPAGVPIIDTPAIAEITASVLPGTETGLLTDVTALVSVSAITIPAVSIGKALIDTTQLTSMGAIILQAADAITTTDAGTMTSLPTLILVGSEEATAIDTAILAKSQGLFLCSAEKLSVADIASLTSLIANIITSAVGTDHDINTIFGTPVIIPILSGRPAIKTKLRGKPSIIRR